MELLQVHTVEEALVRLDIARCLLREEQVSLDAALGRVLLADIASPEHVPNFSRSTVDGYAVIAADTAGAGESIPVILELIGQVEMGQNTTLALTHGQCAYVPTGGMLPEGADAVVMVEYCEPFPGSVAVADAVSPGRNVVWLGEDCQSGQKVLSAGRRLRPADCAALAALGVTHVPVAAPLKLRIWASGDEVITPGRQIVCGQVRDCNSFGVAALAEQAGFEAQMMGILPDDFDIIRDELAAAKDGADILVISGGSSQGIKDMTSRIFNRIAEPGVFSHGLALKPGKPTILAWDEASSTLLIGLPGHPVAALLTFRRVVIAWWQQLSGQIPDPPLPAQLSVNVPAAAGRETLQLVTLQQQADRSWLAIPLLYKSGLITSLTAADGYFILPRDAEGLPAGSPVEVHLL